MATSLVGACMLQPPYKPTTIVVGSPSVVEVSDLQLAAPHSLPAKVKRAKTGTWLDKRSYSETARRLIIGATDYLVTRSNYFALLYRITTQH